MTTLDVHVETGPTVQNTILIENNAVENLIINGLRFRDNATNAYDTTGSRDCGPLTILNSSNNGFQYIATPPVGVAANDVCMFNYKSQAHQ